MRAFGGYLLLVSAAFVCVNYCIQLRARQIFISRHKIYRFDKIIRNGSLCVIELGHVVSVLAELREGVLCLSSRHLADCIQAVIKLERKMYITYKTCIALLLTDYARPIQRR